MLAINESDPRPRDLRRHPKTRKERAQDRRDHVDLLKRRLGKLHETTSGAQRIEIGRAYAKVAFCGVRRGEYHYGCEEHGAWYQTITCKHALCPWCSAKRAGRLLSIYKEHCTHYLTRKGEPRAVMLTLTQKGKGGETFRDGVARLRKTHRKFTKILRD